MEVFKFSWDEGGYCLMKRTDEIFAANLDNLCQAKANFYVGSVMKYNRG